MNQPSPVVLLTGAAGGIGVETAKQFAAAGFRLALVDLQAERLTELVDQLLGSKLVNSPHEVCTLAGDLSDLEFAQRAVQETINRFSQIDVLVNNAAMHDMTNMRTATPRAWQSVLDVNLTAPAFLAKWAAESMESRNRGVIINISSIEAAQPKSLCPAYIAAKAGLEGLTYNLANLYGPAGIRVVAIQPGAIDTNLSNDYVNSDGADASLALREATEDRTPLGRWGTAEEIARTIRWLASDDASFITGTVIRADGGLTHHLVPYSVLGAWDSDKK